MEWPDAGAILGRRWQPLSELARMFFPTLASDGTEAIWVPCPLTDEFWREYAEPVTRYVGRLRQLAGILEGVFSVDPTRTYEEYELDPAYLEARSSLVSLTGATVPAVDIEYADPSTSTPGRFVQRWHFPSLLASLAMMMLRDLTEGGRVHQCPVCQKMFVSSHYRATYCSETCRNTDQKRRQRRRKKESGGARREGSH